MRKKVLLKRMAAMGMAAALAISSFGLPESQVTVYAGSVTADTETVPEETPETETPSEQKSDETTEATENTDKKEETGENTDATGQTETPSAPEAAAAPEAENEPEAVTDPGAAEDSEQTEDTEQTEDMEEPELSEETEELAAAGTAFYSKDESKSSESLDLKTEDWKNKKEIAYDENIPDITVPENYTMTATVSLDDTSYSSLANGENYFKIQGVVKLTDDWKWTQSEDIKQLKKDSFTKQGSAYTTDISISFTDITPAALKGIYFEIVGQGFNGTVSVSNVKLLKAEDTAPLPSQGPYTVDDFENAAQGTNGGWTKEEGYKYDGDIVTTVTALNGSNQLEVKLDYSKNSTEGWSEAKIKKNIAAGIDVSAYNLLTFDITYPSSFSGFKVKGFANNSGSGTEIINKDTAVDGTDIGGGMKKAAVSIKFQPNKEKLTDLTLGIVGVNTVAAHFF